jgi:hypothetical protein
LASSQGVSKSLIRQLRFGGVALHGVGSSEAELSDTLSEQIDSN